MGDILITKITNTENDFYAIMGRFLSRREIVKELGYSVWDDDGKVWFVATDDGNVCGFVAVTVKSDNINFCSDYVLPEYRHKGIYEALSVARLYEYRDKEITATVTGASVDRYLANGFEKTGIRGKYHTVKRVPK